MNKNFKDNDWDDNIPDVWKEVILSLLYYQEVTVLEHQETKEEDYYE